MKCFTQSSYMVLGLLAKEPMSGYDMKKIMAKIANFYWSESNAQIYPTLKKLEQEGFLTSAIDDDSGGRQKRVYHITDSGRQVLLDWLQQDCTLTPYREEILLKLGRGEHCGDQRLIEMLEDYRQQVQQRLYLHEHVIEHLQEAHAGHSDQRYLLMVHDHVRRILLAKMQWCEDTLANLQDT